MSDQALDADADVRRVAGYCRWAMRIVWVSAIIDAALLVRSSYLLLTVGVDVLLFGTVVTAVAFAVFLVQWGTFLRHTRVVPIPRLSGSSIVSDGITASPADVDGVGLVDDRFMLGPGFQAFRRPRGQAAAITLRDSHDGVATLLAVGPGAAAFFDQVKQLGYSTRT